MQPGSTFIGSCFLPPHPSPKWTQQSSPPPTPPPFHLIPFKPCSKPPFTPLSCSKPLHLHSEQKKCLQCGKIYSHDENGPLACTYHGHMTGDKGLYAIAPPHQGIDGEWTDESGVIVYKWNEPGQRLNTGTKNWKRRWTCCGVYEEDAPPCRREWHVSYDDGATLF